MFFSKARLLEQVERVAFARQQRFGVKPPQRIANIISRARSSDLAFGDLVHSFGYLLALSPRQLFRLLMRYLSDHDTPGRKRKISALAAELRTKLSPEARIVEEYFERRIYSRDLARVPKLLERLLHRTTPLLVAQPRSQADLEALVQFAQAKNLPIYPRGISSSAFGGAVPTLNGIVIDFSTMNRILSLDLKASLVRCEPGVRWSDMNSFLAPYGLAPRTTPTSLFSTVGGWVNTGGLGINGFKYGHLREAIENLTVVYPNSSVEKHNAADPRLNHLVGSEGQFGLIGEITLRLRPRAAFSRVALHYFPNSSAAFSFAGKLVTAGHQPAHLAFYDKTRLKEENEIFRARNPRSKKTEIVREQDALLIVFDNAAEAERFERDQALNGNGQALPGGAASDALAGRYLWSERYFPLKAQRHGPSMLASEVVLELARVPAHIERAKRLANNFGVELAFEVFIARPGPTQKDRAPECVTIASFLCSAHRWDYSLKLLLVQLLTGQAVALGGRPYGFGIWNTPFLKLIFSAETFTELKRFKAAVDPKEILNPQKFFRVRTWLFNIPGLLFSPLVYNFGLRVAAFLAPLGAPLLRPLLRHSSQPWKVPELSLERGRKLIAETLDRCTSCGACISVCPAYIVTGEELVTARSKLRVADALFKGAEITSPEAQSTFQCVKCGLCEEVCQTALPLRACYEALEAKAAERFGYPHDLINNFMRKVDSETEKVLNAYGLTQPAWSAPTHSLANSAPAPLPLKLGSGSAGNIQNRTSTEAHHER